MLILKRINLIIKVPFVIIWVMLLIITAIFLEGCILIKKTFQHTIKIIGAIKHWFLSFGVLFGYVGLGNIKVGGFTNFIHPPAFYIADIISWN